VYQIVCQDTLSINRLSAALGIRIVAPTYVQFDEVEVFSNGMAAHHE